ncbi:MAG: hypothetical protein PUI85_05785 [Eubacteriales bacterium]|nr:hypothetical protein [Eubacteriales bacterium]MDY3332798.1 hypothetical protein [Gallibacter sp.]
MGEIIKGFVPRINNNELFGNKITEEKINKFTLKDIKVSQLIPCENNPSLVCRLL